VGDAPVGEALVDALDSRDGIQHAAMDKAYDSNAIRAQLDAKGITPVIPPRPCSQNPNLYARLLAVIHGQRR